VSIARSRVRSSFVVLGAAAATLSVGCMTRPVSKLEPQTKVSITATVASNAIDKIDLLLAIDNSSSMADKQAILADAVPDLVTRFVTPNCVDAVTGDETGKVADPTKPDGEQCAQGGKPEFKPIADIHIAIVSSSLGAFGDGVCDESANPRKNDHGHLLADDKSGGALADAPAGFLAWFPSTQANQGKTAPAVPIADQTKLISDFQQMVVGVGENGCGLEAQLESWYHFLVQPDPWVRIAIDTTAPYRAHYDGVDETILKERHDFLRPDSLVAVVMLTDEDDSFSDPLSIGGNGYYFSLTDFPRGDTRHAAQDAPRLAAPRATAACATNPSDPACTSCWDSSVTDAMRAADPSCSKNGGYYTAQEDSLNVRFVRMKERYGVDPQYPVERYSRGLSNPHVPASAEEHDARGAYQVGGGSCTNPLFAAAIPASLADAKNGDLCHLAAGTRTAGSVYFAIIGGVPNQLLHFDAKSSDKSKLSDDDWVKIMGKDPSRFDHTGIDAHMWQAIAANEGPRAGLPPPSDESGDDGSDPVMGREWDTLGADLQFACTFPLDAQRSCTKGQDDCDCNGEQSPPLCGADGNTPSRTQTRGKAYPTIRELRVARALGDQGIAASLCPRTIDLAGKTLEPKDQNGAPNPLYGYRPAVKSIADRLRDGLTVQCLPEQLARDASNDVPCLVLAELPATSATDCGKVGLVAPEQEILTQYERDHAGTTTGGPVCVLPQIATPAGASCSEETNLGWCYVESSGSSQPARHCSQAILFSSATDLALKGAKYTLECIQQTGDPTAR
jgi:hypothetical protein